MASTQATLRRHIISVEVVGDENLRRLQTSADQLGARMRNLNAMARTGGTAFVRMGQSSGQLGRQMQNVGFQVQDFAVQVASGTAASRALAQQLPQLLGGFGLLGVSLGALVAVGAALAPMFGEINLNMQTATALLGSFAPVIEGLLDSFKALGSGISSALKVVIQNLDRLLYYGTALVTVLGVRLAAAFVISGGAASALAGGLALVQAAVISLVRLLPMLIAAFAIGELAHRFAVLARNVGGFGEALNVLKEIAGEVFLGMQDHAEAAGHALTAVWKQIQAGFLRMVSAIRVAWADVMADIAASMADIPALTFGDTVIWDFNPLRGVADAMAASAARVRDEQTDLTKMADEYGKQSVDAWADAADAANRGSKTIGDALTRLRDLTTDTNEGLDNLLSGGGGEDGKGGGGAAGATAETKKLTEQVRELSQYGKTLENSFNSAFRTMIDGSKSAGEAFGDMILGMLRDITSMLMSQQFQQFLLAMSQLQGFGWLGGVSTPSAAGASASAFAAPQLIPMPQLTAANRDGAPSGSGSMLAYVQPAAPIGSTSGSSDGLSVVVNNNTPAEVAVSESRDPTGERVLQIDIDERVAAALRAGPARNVLSTEYGLRRRTR